MYDFHYNFTKKNFDNELFFTNAYSLTCDLKSENVQNFFKWKDETNKKVIGKMKDEFGGVIVTEFVGLKSKMYSLKKIDGKESNTAKKMSIATKVDKFKDVLFNEKVIRHRIKIIQSKKRKLGTYEIEKISLSCFDDKR